jgi:two-component system sensor histidine kinase QseC
MIMAATTDWNERGLLLRPGLESRPGRKVDMQYQIVPGARPRSRS